MVGFIGAEGDVELDSVPDGRYGVMVQCAESALREGPNVLAVAGSDIVGLMWKVAAGLGLAIHVVDGTGAAVPFATFQMRMPPLAGGATPLMPLTADGAGRYDYPRTLSPGKYLI